MAVQLEIGRTVREPIPQQDRKPLPLPAAGVAPGRFRHLYAPRTPAGSHLAAGGQRRESRSCTAHQEQLGISAGVPRRPRLRLLGWRFAKAS